MLSLSITTIMSKPGCGMCAALWYLAAFLALFIIAVKVIRVLFPTAKVSGKIIISPEGPCMCNVGGYFFCMVLCSDKAALLHFHREGRLWFFGFGAHHGQIRCACKAGPSRGLFTVIAASFLARCCVVHAVTHKAVFCPPSSTENGDCFDVERKSW